MDAVSCLRGARRIVIKIGSAILVDHRNGRIKDAWLKAFALDISELRRTGRVPLIVSSGSIALGRSVLGLGTGILSLEQSQAAAAVGQIRLARAYEEALAPHGLVAAQILLTLDDSGNRRRYLNSRATFENLLAQSVVPVVNENDTVATDEIRFGDNDRLAAQVAAMTNADCMVLLSDVDGLYDQNPTKDPAARHIAVVRRVTPELEGMASDAGTALAKGGMRTKLLAARTASRAGCATLITDGKAERPVARLERGGKATLICPQGRSTVSAKRLDWLHESARPGHHRQRRACGAEKRQVASPGRGHRCQRRVWQGRPGRNRGTGQRCRWNWPDTLHKRRSKRHLRAKIVGSRKDSGLPGARRAGPPRRHGELDL